MIPDLPMPLIIAAVLLLFVYGEFRLRYIARLRAQGHLPKRPPLFLLVFGSPRALMRFSEASRQG